MRNFRITVNGKAYEVGVEEIRAGSQPVTVVPAPAPQPVRVEPARVETSKDKPAVTAAPKTESPKAKPVAGDGVVSAPMPGTVSDILVSVGDRVSKGQVLVMLEAMKMQNEIMAGYDGIVESIETSKGASVNTGDALIVLRS